MRKILSRTHIEARITNMWESFDMTPETNQNREKLRESILAEEKKLLGELQLQQEIFRIALDACYVINSDNPLAAIKAFLPLHDACKGMTEPGGSPTKCMTAYQLAHEKQPEPAEVNA